MNENYLRLNENYLRYLTSFDGQGSLFCDYPTFDTNWISKDFFTPKDHSFLKQELKPMSFLPKERRVFTINVESINDEDIQYLLERLKRSLMVPSRFLDTSALNNPTDYFDEFH